MYKIPDKTVFIGKKIISLPICESTNSLMISMAQSQRMEEGTVIITENQTSGRGQSGNQWVVDAGANLTFSVFLKPSFIEPSQQFWLSMAVGLAICDSISEVLNGQSPENVGWSVKQKWPNDILINAKKVCGILIENQIQGNQLAQSVVGIGINVNQKYFEWNTASSLSLFLGYDLNNAEVFESVLVKLEARYEQLRRGDFQKLKDDYYAVLFWKGEEHQFQDGKKIFTGIVEGIDEAGRLLVKLSSGIERFNFKEIKFLL